MTPSIGPGAGSPDGGSVGGGEESRRGSWRPVGSGQAPVEVWCQVYVKRLQRRSGDGMPGTSGLSAVMTMCRVGLLLPKLKVSLDNLKFWLSLYSVYVFKICFILEKMLVLKNSEMQRIPGYDPFPSRSWKRVWVLSKA